MNRRPQPPCILEDRTGLHTASDFDDIYDRIFFRVAPVPERPGVVGVYRMNHRASRHRDSLPFQTKPLIILEFHPTNHALGNITFVHLSGNNVSTYMGHYLKKTSFFGGSLSRKFTASDGREYRWSYRTVAGQEWTCNALADNAVVAHFDLKPPGTRTYGVSGNVLTIYEPYYEALTSEILVSLTIMRHIAQYKL